MNDYHWPQRASGVYLGADSRITPPTPVGWFGSLLDGKTDASGLQYMRNRYYDPASGRFTQRDPIGLAGGINQYGYAGGDPIGNSDPFGLCAQGADSVKVSVEVECPNGTKESHTIWIHRVTDPATLEQLALAAGQLVGGNRHASQQEVRDAVGADIAEGNVYELPTSVAGGKVLEHGMTRGFGMALRADHLANFANGRFNKRPKGSPFTSCGTLGHEGYHRVLNATGPVPDQIAHDIMSSKPWKC